MIESLVKGIVFARVPIAAVTILAGLVEIVAGVPEFLHVLALHDVQHFESYIPQGLDSRIPLDGVLLDFGHDLVWGQFGRIRPRAVVQISLWRERPANLEQV